MMSLRKLCVALSVLTFSLTGIAASADDSAQAEKSASAKPLRALLIAGGCCHDYAGQHKVLCEGIQQRANVRVDVYWTDDKSTNPPLSLFNDPNWADGYDVIIHDECAASNRDVETVKRVVAAHQEIPAVHLHCAMHSFRAGTEDWFRHLGIQSSRHGPHKPVAVEIIDQTNPITKGLEHWVIEKEELYNNVKVYDGIKPLARGHQTYQKDGEEVTDESIVAWTNETQGARSFSTTLGHYTDTVQDDRYLDLVTRGLLWSCDKLNDTYLTPYEGENKITFVKANSAKEKNKKDPKQARAANFKADDFTLAGATASSEESNKGNYIWHAIDGDTNTRWCAASGSFPQWLALELPAPARLTGAKLEWESRKPYRYIIEGSTDNKDWFTLSDQSQNTNTAPFDESFSETKPVKWVRITGLGTSGGSWCSIREVNLKGDGLKPLRPKLWTDPKYDFKAVDYAKSGNTPPKIEQLTAEEEAEFLKQVKTSDEFDVTLFANSSAANYPVFVAAAPNGTLYVSSDGNGSLGRSPERGRIIRLRDQDGDGHADETKVFCEVDAPRGIVWDHDRLYVMHPPHLSAYVDSDGDGVADEEHVLVKNLAFGYDKRPADHTTNGLTLGVDGWLYVAGGDFGFIDAEGTDGRKIAHRGGGVIRVRPDGTGLEIYSTGTRNILEVPASPLMDLFARDNTNDGGGWDVRFHHFSGMEDHGYPRLYKNFGDEHVAPLADYGGGSGCGGLYLSEPGFPENWNNAPLTCDWGSDALWKHTVEPDGATFKETIKPEKLVSVYRATDGDVDGLSNIYQASWKGATFNWAGPDVGYIVRVTPKDYKAEPLPEFESLSDNELITQLDSPSMVRRMAAQRTLLRRPETPEMTDQLIALARNIDKPLENRVCALYAITQRSFDCGCYGRIIDLVTPLTMNPELEPHVLRAIGDIPVDDVTEEQRAAVALAVINGLNSQQPATRLQAIVSAARLGLEEIENEVAAKLGDSDPAVAHTAFQALGKMNAREACFAVLVDPSSNDLQRKQAAFALMRMHDPVVVDEVIRRLDAETRPEVRQPLLSVMCRLYFHEGEWKGDSWGTRPDTRGPYYQPETWSESERISKALHNILNGAGAAEAAYLAREMTRNRISSDAGLMRVIALAKENPSVLGDAVAQMATADEIPQEGIDIIKQAVDRDDVDQQTYAHAALALAKCVKPDLVPTLFASLSKSSATNAPRSLKNAAEKEAIETPLLENCCREVVAYANSHTDKGGSLADRALLHFAENSSASPEARELAKSTLLEAWKDEARRVRLINESITAKSYFFEDDILASVKDPNSRIANAANYAVKRLNIKPKKTDNSPKIETLDLDDVRSRVIAEHGDKQLGERLFVKATCNSCHTVSKSETPKGPYLGNISKTYKRPALAEAILFPSKTIAQGFATTQVLTAEGKIITGFVTDEQADQITMRDSTAKEYTILKDDIEFRKTLKISAMPEGLMKKFTVREMSSLVDYLESLKE
ncbi:DUF7133 domain-containing protein [Calycomorphotria hydatis]|uniref:Trehalose utilization n=1 Tax=Calycomorphotria hydatis TaxID=2528027 RepID=A0A517T441_9PLAN|nr:ThuA domain-containing protein [Calycomorphotria hydatis]QDT63145.1 Trehalose utilization [Calycomorphotria hydatis]